jgi:ribulose-phosphate 3-epimerase
MIEVVPSLPSPTFEELEKKIGSVRGLVTGFQIDVCDGKFVQSTSWPMHPEDRPQFERIVRGEEQLPFKDDFDFEVHFMAHRPEMMIPDWIRAGVVRALIHVEAEHDFAACHAAAEGKIELGISLLIGTPLERIDEYIEHITVVQLMGIAHIGVQGQPFDPRVLDSIREVKRRYPDMTVEIDGAVNIQSAPQLVAAGATRLAPGSYVLSSADPKAAIEALKAIPA